MRTLKRWIAVCLVTSWPPEKAGTQRKACEWNDREDKELHLNPKAALREARDHAGGIHTEAREVTVQRTYKLEREEIVGG